MFCTWGRMVDKMKCAKFQLNRFRGFEATGAENDPRSVPRRPYDRVRTDVRHCDNRISCNINLNLCKR